MQTLTGHTLLIVESDLNYSLALKHALLKSGANCFHAKNIEEAKKILKGRDVELVISNYYLVDGMIHQLIDWCKSSLDMLPMFISLGQPFANDRNILQHHSIVADFSKTFSLDELISRMANFLKCHEELRKSLLDLVEPKGIVVELVSDNLSCPMPPLEIGSGGIYLSGEYLQNRSCSGFLRISIYDGERFKTFSVLGYFEGTEGEILFFEVHPSYSKTWALLLQEIQSKQVQVSRFINKVAGY